MLSFVSQILLRATQLFKYDLCSHLWSQVQKGKAKWISSYQRYSKKQTRKISLFYNVASFIRIYTAFALLGKTYPPPLKRQRNKKHNHSLLTYLLYTNRHWIRNWNFQIRRVQTCDRFSWNCKFRKEKPNAFLLIISTVKQQKASAVL